MKKGTFFVLSGPSGSGKGTVLKEVLRKSDRIVYSVSATSRSPRAGEVAHVVDELQVILLGALDVDVGAVHLAGGHEQAGIVVAIVKVVGVVDVA